MYLLMFLLWLYGVRIVIPVPLSCSEDKGSFGQLADAIRTNYNERFDEIRKTWGGGIMGIKARNAKAKIEKLKARELAQKM